MMADKETAIEKVWKLLDEEAGYVVGLTQDIVRIPSVNPRFVTDAEQNREAAVQDRLQQETEALGFKSDRWEVFPDRPNLVADLAGDEDKSLILCGHIDVVPIGEKSGWTADPFGGEIKDGRLYGRGAVDMKGGLAACFAAARAIRKAGIQLQGRLSIHAVVDEEAGGFGAIDAVKKGKLAKAAIVAEPSWGDVHPCEGGLEWLRVTIPGQQGHSAMRFNEIWPQRDEPGRLRPAVNAIDIAARFLEALRQFENSRCRYLQHPLLPPGMNTINVGVIRGGAGLGPDGLPMVMTNPAIIPDTVAIDIDYKFLPQQTKEEIRSEFETFVRNFCEQDLWLQKNPIKVEWELGGLHFPPMNTPVDHPIVQSLVRRQTQVGKAPRVRGFEAVADCAHYAGAGVDAVIYGPSGDGFHGYDEYVDIASLHETTKTIAAAVIDWCDIR